MNSVCIILLLEQFLINLNIIITQGKLVDCFQLQLRHVSHIWVCRKKGFEIFLANVLN